MTGAMKVCRECNLPKRDDMTSQGKFYRLIDGIRVPIAVCIDCISSGARVEHIRFKQRQRREGR